MTMTGPSGPVGSAAITPPLVDHEADLTPKQLAVLINKTERTIQRWCASGDIPARRIGGTWLIKPRAIAERDPDLWEEYLERAGRRMA